MDERQLLIKALPHREFSVRRTRHFGQSREIIRYGGFIAAYFPRKSRDCRAPEKVARELEA